MYFCELDTGASAMLVHCWCIGDLHKAPGPVRSRAERPRRPARPQGLPSAGSPHSPPEAPLFDWAYTPARHARRTRVRGATPAFCRCLRGARAICPGLRRPDAISRTHAGHVHCPCRCRHHQTPLAIDSVKFIIPIVMASLRQSFEQP